jgi:periplasmic copper chaperone A
MLNLRTVIRTAALAGLLAFAGASWLAAHEFKAGDLDIRHPWTRATPAGASTAAGYLKVINNGKQADKLVAASTEAAAQVEIHEMSMENGVMKMRQLKDGIEIEPGATVELKPGGAHLMIIGPKEPFKAGTMVKGTLTFEKAGAVPVEFKVESIGGATADGAAHKH